MRRILISFEGLDATNEVRLRDLLGEHGYKFWHRFSNIWILITPDEADGRDVTDLIDEHIGRHVNYIAVDFTEGTFHGSLPPALWTWFDNNLGVVLVEKGTSGKTQ